MRTLLHRHRRLCDASKQLAIKLRSFDKINYTLDEVSDLHTLINKSIDRDLSRAVLLESILWLHAFGYQTDEYQKRLCPEDLEIYKAYRAGSPV